MSQKRRSDVYLHEPGKMPELCVGICASHAYGGNAGWLGHHKTKVRRMHAYRVLAFLPAPFLLFVLATTPAHAQAPPATAASFACEHIPNPASLTFDAAGGSRNFALEIRCGSWSASISEPFVTLTSGMSGPGYRTSILTVKVDPNPTPYTRTARVKFNGVTAGLLITQAPCSFSFSPTALTVGAGSSENDVFVSTQIGCGWTATTTAPTDFLRLPSAFGRIGSGYLRVSVSGSTSIQQRVATVGVGTAQLNVTQASACTYSINPAHIGIASAAASGTLFLQTQPGCPWSASENDEFLAFTGPLSGTGPSALPFTIPLNPFPAVRTGGATIQGRSFTYSQNGVPGPAPCTKTINPTSVSVGAAGGDGTIFLTTGETCTWSLGSNANWISVPYLLGVTPTGSAPVPFKIGTNPFTSPRTGTATIAGITFTVTQAGTPVCGANSLTPASISLGHLADSGTIFVTAPAGCPWSVVTGSSFISFPGATSGTGPGKVPFSIATNPGGARIGTATIAGQTFAVTQAAAPVCTYSINPPSVRLGHVGDSGTLYVTAPTGCAWTASSYDGFLTFPDGASGTGTRTLRFAVATNDTNNPRIAYATVAGRTFTASQSAAPCTATLSATALSVGNIQDAASISVAVANRCAWTAQSNASWLRVTSPANITGSGRVHLAIETNYTTVNRSATVVVAGQAVTVQQRPLDTARRDRERSRADFNGDGWSDLLWRDSIKNYLAVWTLNGSHTTHTALPVDMFVDDSDWQIVGTGDFSGDGRPDIVWHHRTRGWLYLWAMNGGQRLFAAPFSHNGGADPDWRIAGVGDFNGDDKPDILWQHDTQGWLILWRFVGTTRIATVELSPGQVDAEWKVAAVADLDGDADSDLIWRNSITGDLGAWIMEGTTRETYVALTPGGVDESDWQIVSTADINGDGAPDLVWHHRTNGTVVVWYMNGVGRIGYGQFPIPVDAQWRIMGPK